MLGLKPGTIKLVRHDKRWRAYFNSEKKLIASALGQAIVSVEHIGSTSIPGIAAKPIIDILIGVKSMNDAQRLIRLLRKAGYRNVRDRGDVRKRIFFVKGSALKSTHHLHVVKHEGNIWRAHTSFPRYLREQKTWVKKYEALKKRLANDFKKDRDSYTTGKGMFIRMIIGKLRKKPLRTRKSF